MIDFVFGTLHEKGSDFVVVEVSGIGYMIHIPEKLSYDLPLVGESLKLHTHFIHKEDAMELIGFLNPMEREIFRHLITVSGIGARLGVKIISDLAYDEVIRCVLDKDATSLSRVNGLGKKTSEKIILELENKFKKLYPYNAVSAGKENSSIARTAIEALMALGYRERESMETVNAITKEFNPSTTEEIVKQSLKSLAKLTEK